MTDLTVPTHCAPTIPPTVDQRRHDLASAGQQTGEAIRLASAALATYPAGSNEVDSLTSALSYLNSAHRTLTRMGALEA